MSFDSVKAGGDEDREGRVTRVAAAFTTLCANDVDAALKGLGDVFRVSDHANERKPA